MPPEFYSGPIGSFAAPIVTYQGPGDIAAAAGITGTAYWGLHAFTAAIATAGTLPVADVYDVTNTLGPYTCSVNSNGTLNTTPIGSAGPVYSVGRVYDQVGSNHISIPGANRPVFLINGFGLITKPVMGFNSSTPNFLQSASVVNYAQPTWVTAVAQGTNQGSAGMILGDNQSGASSLYAGAAANTMAMNAGAALTATSVAGNAWHLVQGIYNSVSGTSELYVDQGIGGNDQTGNAGTGNWGGASTVFRIGGDNFGQYLTGYIAAIGFWNAVTVANIPKSSMYTNQSAFWNNAF